MRQVACIGLVADTWTVMLEHESTLVHGCDRHDFWGLKENTYTCILNILYSKTRLKEKNRLILPSTLHHDDHKISALNLKQNSSKKNILNVPVHMV